MDIIALLFGLILLGLASQRWGADTTDQIDNAEWMRRERWTYPHAERG